MNEKLYDVIVVGGGISGLGTALRAAEAGFKVVLFEKGNLAEAASANSHRIIHGGFRYLQNFDFWRVLESIKAKREILEKFPKFVVELPCLMPLNGFGLKSKYPVSIAGVVFRALSGFTERISVLEKDDAERLEPFLKNKVPFGALRWNDGLLLDHSGLVTELAKEIRLLGVEINETSEVKQIKKEQNFSVTLANGATYRSKVVIETTGAWLKREGVKWCKAFNLLLKRELGIKNGVGIVSKEKRLYFFVPRRDCTAIGTGYYPFSGDPAEVTVTREEIVDFLKGLEIQISPEDIERVEVGVLPEETGREKIYDLDGHIQVLSTKYTTFLTQAERVLNIAKKYV